MKFFSREGIAKKQFQRLERLELFKLFKRLERILNPEP